MVDDNTLKINDIKEKINNIKERIKDETSCFDTKL